MAGTRPLQDIKAAEIRDAVAALMPELEWADNDHQFLGQVADKLGARHGAGAGASQNERIQLNYDWEKFGDKVVRALNALATAGTLRKAPRGGRLPDGTWASGTRFYTPEAWAQAVQRGQERLRAKEEEQARWRRISERAEALGITLAKPEEPGAHALEQLLDLAEQGKESS